MSGRGDEVGLDGAEVVELAARRPRAAALLDELAALGRGEHALGGADVPAILDRLNGDTMTTTPKPSATPHATSVRLGTEDLDKLDRVVELMATSREARLVGGRWGRSTVLRLAVERGLDALLADAEGTADPFMRPGAPADDLAGPVRASLSGDADTVGELRRLLAALPDDAPILAYRRDTCLDVAPAEIRDVRPVEDDPEAGFDVRPPSPRAPRGAWRRALVVGRGH